ncbi:hypothetical protein M501DRAFT_994049 [Patellaria atrata CBS 101060]|uniref:Uncharacterized protein n=1 Tax=Patellaria atrata CBS 101060 TaxID=1346257 RepID=A0A9P4VRQ4_9PEZI|nr:hypothetical protein M501DRAFT_994049 [Patellaria atrata CBS 101060]
MAPDLNSVPPSPRPPNPSTTTTSVPSLPTSRRASQIYPMSPPPLPLASPGGTLPPVTHHQATHPFPPLSPITPGANPPQSVDSSGVPMRHPRPLTAAELHLELEKEQEAVVNRLTRELSALRAHSASVASTASSTSTRDPTLVTDVEHPATNPLVGLTHPTTARRHRSSSSLSRTSTTAHTPSGIANTVFPHRVSITASHVYDGARDIANGPAQRERTGGSVSSLGAVPLSSPRYEEVQGQRMELEEAKRENEVLRRRVRELEAMLAGRRRTSSVESRRSVSVAASEGGRSVSGNEARGRIAGESTPR